MCDKCDADLMMYGAVRAGFSCSDVTPDLLAEEHNGIPRFASRKTAAFRAVAVEDDADGENGVADAQAGPGE